MKLYLFVRADLRLIKKPEWLDAFRESYDEIFPYHISLKRAVEVSKSDQQLIEKKVADITKDFKPFEVRFKELFFGKTKFGNTIMIRAENVPQLHALRDRVFESFKKYNTYIQPEHKAFDEDFNPHITIARHLSDEQLLEAKKEIQKPLEVVAKIDSLNFAITSHPHDVLYPPVFEATVPFPV